MKRPQSVSPGSLNRMLKAADDAWALKDFQQCIDTLERASRLDPANSTVLLRLGRCYGLRYDYAAAERCLEKAVRVAPKKTPALALAAETSTVFPNQQLAQHYYQRALAQADALPETFVRLAEIYERHRRAEEASALVDRALQLNPTCGPALLARARSERQADRLEEAEKILRSIPPTAARDVRACLGYELGGILDRQGRYEEAMAALLEAKALLRADAAPLAATLKVLRGWLRDLQTNLSAEVFERWHALGPSLPTPRRLALLCGHPRSGTTLLEQVLDSHPDITSVEETMIFYDDAYSPLARGFPQGHPMLSTLEAAQPNALQQSREAYFRSVESFLGQPVAGRLLVDKNPSLTFLTAHMVRVFPEIKFLVALRDPRDVCLSVFMQAFVPVQQTSSAYLALDSTVEEYAALMGMWMTVAPLIKNPFIQVRYEDMVEDLESAARRVLEFFGVPWDARVLRFHEHARQKRVLSPTYAEVAKPVFKRAVGRWRHYQRHLEPYLAKLEPFAKAFGYE